MKQIFLTAIFFVLTVSIITSCRSVGFAQSKQDKVISSTGNTSTTNKEGLLPAQKGFVNDFANILDPKTKKELEQSLTKFKSQAKIDFVIATVKTTGDKSIFDYSLAAAKDWEVGAKNPDKAGVFLLIAVEDRRWHIQITRVLQEVLSVAETDELGAVMRPYFREQKYGEGVTKCAEAVIKMLKGKRGVK